MYKLIITFHWKNYIIFCLKHYGILYIKNVQQNTPRTTHSFRLYKKEGFVWALNAVNITSETFYGRFGIVSIRSLTVLEK